MQNTHKPWQDLLVTAALLTAAFFVSLLLQKLVPSQSLVSMIFVLAVFLISICTGGYLWGILASFTSVLIDNYVFAFPYFAFDFLTPENLIGALMLLAVSVITCTLTTQVRSQERVRAEAEKEKMRGNLLRAISHDLRTPLTTIYGSTSVIIENYDILPKPQQLRLMRQVCEDADSLIRMVENLLSVTRVGDESVKVKKTPTVLEELIDATLLKFSKQYPMQPVEVSIPEDFISIPMDALLIQQVLINLLGNAVLHAQGMTRLCLTVSAQGGDAVFEVADNGSGIPRDRMDSLFSGRLYGQDTPSDHSRNGMGIGLSVCATIIKAHGGEISAGNQKDGGALFRFRLEIEKENHEQQ